MTSPSLFEIPLHQTDAWMRALATCAPYDFYHLPAYHLMAEQDGEGTARLLVFTEEPYTIVFPLLLRPINDSPDQQPWCDAASVYGYVGPLASSPSIPEPVIQRFQSALLAWCLQHRIVTILCRLNPLLPQRPILAGLGELRRSESISINLTLSPEDQQAQYRRSLKFTIHKLRRSSLTVVHDESLQYLPDFIAIYTETMRRVHATDRYFHDENYFRRLSEALGPALSLFVCLQDGKPICGGLFVHCQGILQFHLGGTLNSALPLAPMKLLLDEVRTWASSHALRALHLGGGTRAYDPNDSVLHFKRAFTHSRDEFAVWRWVVLPTPYAALCAHHANRLRTQNLQPSNPDFFPPYRCPGVPVIAAPGNA